MVSFWDPSGSPFAFGTGRQQTQCQVSQLAAADFAQRLPFFQNGEVVRRNIRVEKQIQKKVTLASDRLFFPARRPSGLHLGTQQYIAPT